jgi:hypothetical protein
MGKITNVLLTHEALFFNKAKKLTIADNSPSRIMGVAVES